MNKDFNVVLFDIGGVLVEVEGFSKIMNWMSGIKHENELRNKWFSSPTMDDYHKGRISTECFIQKMTDEFGLSVDRDTFIKVYESYPKKLYEGAAELVRQMADKYTVASFSNNCALHWDKLCREDKMDQLFHKNFLSHYIGMQKPDREFYEYVLSHLNTDPNRILFFDDNQPNVDMAKELGIQAVRVNGFSELMDKVKELKLI
ncbi:MAG: HAD-IA family hydrolase [Clostridia bacterium]|nr:HAD-IA family hydrolase [Clostridia bacterium]